MAMEAAGMFAWEWEAGAGTMRWSENAAAVIGCRPEELPADTRESLFFIAPEDAPRVQRAYEETVARRQDVYRTEFRGRGEPSAARHYLVHARILYDDRGAPAQVCGVTQDITERKRAEAARAQLAAIVESSEDAIYIYDFDETILSWNRGAEKLYGWTAAEITGRPVTIIIPPDHATEARDLIIPAVQRGETLPNLETRRMRRDGSVFDALLTASPVRDAAGRVAALSIIVRDISRWRRAEEALQAQRELLEIIVRHLPAAVSLIRGGDLRLQWVNPAYQAIAPGKEMVGRTLAELWPESGQDFDRICRRVLETGEPHRVEDELNMTRRAPDGPLEPASFTWSLHRIRLPGDEGWGLLNVARETTERRRTEAALRAARDTFRHLVENSPFGVYAVDADFRLVQVSAGAQKVFENVRPLIGRDFAEVLRIIWPEPFANEAIGRFRHTLETGETYRAPSTVERRQDIDEVESYDWKIERVTLPDGRPGVVCHFYDLSERQRFEEALRHSEERFRLASDAAAALVYDVDLTGEREVIVHGLERVTGYQADEADLSRQWWHSLIHPADLPAHVENYARHLATGGTYRAVYRIRRKDGAWMWVEDTAQVVKDETGASVQLVGAIVDITERQEAEQALRESQQSLQEADRLKDEFLATASHELRTPLTAIVGWTRMLRTGKLDEATAARALETIERNANAQTKLIEDLLDISRIITGKLLLDTQHVEVAPVVMGVVNTIRPTAEAKNIHVETDVDAQAGSVLADPNRLQQVVWNLLSNAVKFTPREGRVEVGVRRVDSQVEISVSDTGEGIEPEFLPYVFDRFRQADGSKSRQHGGLGLGLAIVRHLVEMHGGTVGAESEGRGRGATFRVRLPLLGLRHRAASPAADASAGEPEAAEALAVGCPPRLDGLRVLIVDDDRDTVAMLGAVLSRCGAEVATAGSTAEALRDIERRPPDVLVSDIGMPDADGYELIKRVREQEAERGGRATPALALTAYARAEDRVLALTAGYHVHLSKPVEPAEFTLVVASLAGRADTSS